MLAFLLKGTGVHGHSHGASTPAPASHDHEAVHHDDSEGEEESDAHNHTNPDHPIRPSDYTVALDEEHMHLDDDEEILSQRPISSLDHPYHPNISLDKPPAVATGTAVTLSRTVHGHAHALTHGSADEMDSDMNLRAAFIV